MHRHIGYEGYVSWSAENHTRENVLDHLEREAFYGVGAAMTMGDQPLDFALAFQRDQRAAKFPAAARFFFAAGMAPPGGGPDALLIQGTTPHHAIFGVSTPERGRGGGAENCGGQGGADQILGGQPGQQSRARKKMPPEVYTPLIAEAHKHGITVHAHATNLADQKGVVKAGVARPGAHGGGRGNRQTHVT